MRYAFVQIKFLGIQPSIWVSAGQPLYLFFVLSEWFICKNKFKNKSVFRLSIFTPDCQTSYKRRG